MNKMGPGLAKRVKELSTSTESEAKLKAKLRLQLKARLDGAVVFRHEDRYTAGIPDTSITYNQKTVWLEIKFADPTLRGKEIQEYTAKQLEQAGYCFYVIYFRATNGAKMTLIVKPTKIADWKEDSTIAAMGFNHDFVVDFVEDLFL